MCISRKGQLQFREISTNFKRIYLWHLKHECSSPRSRKKIFLFQFLWKERFHRLFANTIFANENVKILVDQVGVFRLKNLKNFPQEKTSLSFESGEIRTWELRFPELRRETVCGGARASSSFRFFIFFVGWRSGTVTATESISSSSNTEPPIFVSFHASSSRTRLLFSSLSLSISLSLVFFLLCVCVFSLFINPRARCTRGRHNRSQQVHFRELKIRSRSFNDNATIYIHDSQFSRPRSHFLSLSIPASFIRWTI